MTEQQEWQHITDSIKIGFANVRRKGLNAKHQTNKQRAAMIEAAILQTFEQITKQDNEQYTRN